MCDWEQAGLTCALCGDGPDPTREGLLLLSPAIHHKQPFHCRNVPNCSFTITTTFEALICSSCISTIFYNYSHTYILKQARVGPKLTMCCLGGKWSQQLWNTTTEEVELILRLRQNHWIQGTAGGSWSLCSLNGTQHLRTLGNVLVRSTTHTVILYFNRMGFHGFISVSVLFGCMLCPNFWQMLRNLPVHLQVSDRWLRLPVNGLLLSNTDGGQGILIGSPSFFFSQGCWSIHNFAPEWNIKTTTE